MFMQRTVLSVAVVAPVVFAGEIGFKEGSFYSQLSDADRESFRLLINEELDDSADQDIIQWKSETTDLAARIKARALFEHNDATCVDTMAELRSGENPPELYLLAFCEGDSFMGFGRDWVFLVEPTSRFGKYEWVSFEEALVDGLDNEADGGVREWISDQHQFKADFTFVSSAGVGNTRCRTAGIVIEADVDAYSQGEYRFCNSGERWKLLPPRGNFD